MLPAIGGGFFDAVERDNLFITGAFSLLHTLLGTSMQSLLEEMNLPANVSEALLYGQGEFAPFLRLAQACEQFEAARAQLLQIAERSARPKPTASESRRPVWGFPASSNSTNKMGLSMWMPQVYRPAYRLRTTSSASSIRSTG